VKITEKKGLNPILTEWKINNLQAVEKCEK
jgi:hypothetical protein